MTLGMYKLPKLINVPDDILLPDASVAYRMKPVVNLSSAFPGNSNKNGGGDEIQKLAARQNALLERLAKLQEKLNGMNGSQKITTKSSITGLPNLKICHSQQSSLIKRIDELQKKLVSIGSETASPHQTQEDIIVRQQGVLSDMKNLQEMLHGLKANSSAKTSSAETATVESVTQNHCDVVKLVSKLTQKLTLSPCAVGSQISCKEVKSHHQYVVERLLSLQNHLLTTFSRQEGAPSLSSCDMKQTGVVHDIVIKASPLNAPYSVVPLVCSLRKAGFQVYGNFMTHSTCKSTTPATWPALLSPSGEGREAHQISVTILWTDVEQPTLMVSPIHQVPIVGEVNIARYFNRLLPAHVAGCYESTASLSDIARTDALLDEFHMVLSGTLSKREMGQYMSQLERRFQSCLTESPLLQSVMWSALKRLTADGAKLPAAISQWVQSRDSQYIGTSNSPTSSTVKSTQAKVQANSSGFKLTTKNDLLNLLTQLKIEHKCYEHKGVMTVAELLQEAAFVSGVHMKNLFVRDKKKQLYLVSARHNAKVDMKSLATALGCKDLRFADHDILLSTLNISQGHVNAYAIVNDEKRVVKLVLDDMVTSNRDQIVNFHPMVNSSSVSVKCGDLLKFFDHHGRKPTFVTFKDE